jgi:hypothetical protein
VKNNIRDIWKKAKEGISFSNYLNQQNIHIDNKQKEIINLNNCFNQCIKKYEECSKLHDKKFEIIHALEKNKISPWINKSIQDNEEKANHLNECFWNI